MCCATPVVLCSGASMPEQRVVLLLPPKHENVGPQPPRQRTNPFLFFLFLSQHGSFAVFTLFMDLVALDILFGAAHNLEAGKPQLELELVTRDINGVLKSI